MTPIKAVISELIFLNVSSGSCTIGIIHSVITLPPSPPILSHLIRLRSNYCVHTWTTYKKITPYDLYF